MNDCRYIGGNVGLHMEQSSCIKEQGAGSKRIPDSHDPRYFFLLLKLIPAGSPLSFSTMLNVLLTSPDLTLREMSFVIGRHMINAFYLALCNGFRVLNNLLFFASKRKLFRSDDINFVQPFLSWGSFFLFLLLLT